MTDSSAPASPRPRPIVLLVAVALAAAVVYIMWPASAPVAPSNAARDQRKQPSPAAPGTPGSLDVRLEALNQSPPAPDADAGRNPFRFYVKPPPPPPPPPKPVVTAPPGPGTPGYVPPPPPGPPPIPLKFFGTMEGKGKKIAIFQTLDRPGMPIYAAEGETVLGQYRVVKIGVESVTLEYLDGRGRQTIPLRG